jgi:hypothetical protein
MIMGMVQITARLKASLWCSITAIVFES